MVSVLCDVRTCSLILGGAGIPSMGDAHLTLHHLGILEDSTILFICILMSGFEVSSAGNILEVYLLGLSGSKKCIVIRYGLNEVSSCIDPLVLCIV